MTLTAGAKLGPYEILSPLGAGGMGEVYRAKDSRLGREVAIKVLPESMATDTEALARFEREAKAVAALSHPNILALHDIGNENGVAYAVMELLEGETLRARLNAGMIPPRKLAEFARQIAEGLAAAHEKGIVHRDLKPENLFVTKDGRMKILDFGLAKVQIAAAESSSENTPTRSVGTGPGMVMGTVGYMSPEQVRGEPADHRSDIFSFGAVLYEMASGRRAFKRDSAVETMSAILKDEPPELEHTSGKAISMGFRRIIEHCLEKDPGHRFHNARDLAFALESASGDSGAPSSGVLPAVRAHRASRLPLLGALLVGGLLVWGGMAMLRRAPPPANSPVAVRFLTYSGHDTSPAASPDGRTIAFTSSRDGQQRIWLKQLRGGGEVALTTGSDDFPRFSPDGSSILFIRTDDTGSSLYRMSVLGTDLHRVVENATAGDWSPDGTKIAFLRDSVIANTGSSGLFLIDAGGGAEKEIARIKSGFIAAPRWNAEGSVIVLTSAIATGGGQNYTIFRVRVRDGELREFHSATRFGAISSVVWVSSDEVLYLQAESVTGNGVSTSPAKAYRLDLRTGASVPLFWTPVAARSVDLLPDGRVVFDGISGSQSLREYPLTTQAPPRWLTRGNISDRQPAFSTEGEWVVFSSNRAGNLDLWEVSSRTGVVKSLTDDAAEDWDPGFTPDGKHLLWSSNRSGAFEIWMANADGSGARQVTRDGVDAENPTQTRDGRWVIYSSSNPKKPGVWKIHPDGTGAECLVSGGNLLLPEVSPDGQFALYESLNNSLSVTLHAVSVNDGSKEVFQTEVRGFRNTAATLGRSRWMPDGRHIIFTGQDDKGLLGIFIQDFVPGQDTVATRKPLAGFDPDTITESLGLSPDGTRLVLSKSERMFSLLVAEGVTGLSPQRKVVK